MPQQEEIVWHVLTHEHKEHTADWYWAVVLGTLVAAGACIYFRNYMLAAILVIGMGSVVLLKVRGPREHQVRAGARGVTLDGTLYTWKSVQSFWVNFGDEYSDPKLYLTTHSIISPRIAVPLDNTSHGEEVRALCLQYALEEEHKPHFAEHIATIIGL